MGWVQLFFCDSGSSQVSVWPCSITHAQPGALVVLQLLPSSLLAAAGGWRSRTRVPDSMERSG